MPTATTQRFRLKASMDNDDSMVIVEGDRDLALAYAVNIMTIYETAELRFWLGA